MRRRPKIAIIGGGIAGLAAVARFAESSEIEADVVVGADGIHSTVCDQLFGADQPRFTGCLCWRGLVPADRVPAGLVDPSSLNRMGHTGTLFIIMSGAARW